MAGYLRRLVSKNKRRLYQDGFDLDMSYITPRIIAMGLPADGTEGFFRNRLPTVNKFLTIFHGSNVRVYNLCSERAYDASKLGGNVVCFPFDDHQVPSLQLMLDFCQDAEAFLQADSENVIAVHCKAGKGRTGVMIVAFLLYTGVFQSPEEALKEYAARRTVDGKAVTIPSQRRYLSYFHSQIVSLGHLRAPRPETLRLQRLSLRGLPADLADRLCVVIWTREDGPPLRPSPLALLVAQDSRVRISSRFAGMQPIHVPSLRVFQGAATVAFDDDKMWDAAGDIKVEVYRSELRAKHLLCYTWLNTSCLSRDMGGQAQVTLQHQELDKVDELCPHDMALHLCMQACNGAERPGRTQHASASPFQCSPPMKQAQAHPAEELSVKEAQAPPLEELSLSDSEDSNASACLCSPTPGSMQSVQSPAGGDLRSADSPPPSPTVIQAQRTDVPRLFVPGSFASLAETAPSLTPTSKAQQPLHHTARPAGAAWNKVPRRPWSELFGLTSRPLERQSYCGSPEQPPPDRQRRPSLHQLSSAQFSTHKMSSQQLNEVTDDILASWNDIWYGPLTAR
ncbi:hypothetical protein WJX74_005875 [Apatococcus lobatus]|uniref:Phosphatidylinositol-3,4,5-trisphosphate 3-phosphatase n=2 Tax=Apatococcus TaxID=904362 RepID=A0AAW1TA22_9CHLO